VEHQIKPDLGGVDEFEPVFGGGEMDHSEEAVGQLIVSGGDSAIDIELPSALRSRAMARGLVPQANALKMRCTTSASALSMARSPHTSSPSAVR